jgi:hypothetical protein
MALDTTTSELTMFRYPGRTYDTDGELVGVGPWSRVLGVANRLADERGEELPFQMPDRVPWGDDPDDSAEIYPEAWVIVHLADDPVEDHVQVVAVTDRVAELLHEAHAEVVGD